jgi:protein-disulfide isomerase
MRFAIASIVAAAALLGCRQDNQELKRELADIRKELQALRGQPGRAAGPAQAQAPRAPRPDPARTYAVAVAGAPAVGPAAAPVTIVIGYEYACPWCNRQRQPFTALRETYGDDVRIVYRPFVVHEDAAGDAALAACAADRQGHFAEVSDALWSDVFEKHAFDRASVEHAAASVAGIDVARLRRDMDGDCKAWVKRERAALLDLGINGTPQLWVNGRPLAPGYKTLEQMKPLVDEELARARERIAAGTPRDAYYAEWVMKKGLRGLEAVN